VEDKKFEQKCNILYITTVCNFECEYCYEKKDRDKQGFKHKTITKKEIDNFITEMIEREDAANPDHNNTVNIFGGEAFLRYDLIEYALKEISKRLTNIGVEMITNGSTLDDIKNVKKLKELINYCKDNRVYVSMKISFDGSGHFRRVYRDGTSTKETVIKAMDNLSKEDIPFVVSYTVHAGNYKNVMKDGLKLIKRYSNHLRKFFIQFNFEEMINLLTPIGFEEFKSKIKKQAIAVFYKYNIPTCELICDHCEMCDRSTFTGNNYFIPEYGNEFRDSTHYEGHNHFSLKHNIKLF